LVLSRTRSDTSDVSSSEDSKEVSGDDNADSSLLSLFGFVQTTGLRQFGEYTLIRGATPIRTADFRPEVEEDYFLWYSELAPILDCIVKSASFRRWWNYRMGNLNVTIVVKSRFLDIDGRCVKFRYAELDWLNVSCSATTTPERQ
jgi:hypothetical protein